MSMMIVQFLRAMIAEAGFFLAIFCHIGRNWPAKTRTLVLGTGLTAAAGLAVFSYFDFGHYPLNRAFTNIWDVYHYYLGSKYWKEVGYFDLYNYVIIADSEGGGKMRNGSHRELRDYSFRPNREVLREAEAYKAKFTPERWEEFKADVYYFESRMPARRWTNAVTDKGYNASPVWNMVAAQLTNRISTQDALGMRLLVGLDLMLLGVMFTALYFAFGGQVAFLAVIFFGTNFVGNFTHIKGSLLRLDWLALTVIAMCMLKLHRPAAAGALLAYAGCSRIFPFIFLFGIASKCLWDLKARRTLDARYVRFFVSFAVAAAVLLGGSIAYYGGVNHWVDFMAKIRLHDSDLSGLRVGFKYVFLMTYKETQPWGAFEREKLALFADLKLLWYAIQAAVLAITFVVARKTEDYETIPLSYVPVYFLTAPTFYYHTMLIVPFVLFAAKLERLTHVVGVVSMFTMTVVFYILLRWYDLGTTLSFIISCTLLALCGYIWYACWVSGRPAPSESPKSTAKKARG